MRHQAVGNDLLDSIMTKEVQMPDCHGAILFCHILAKFGKMPQKD
jgi:hypothetical protein